MASIILAKFLQKSSHFWSSQSNGVWPHVAPCVMGGTCGRRGGHSHRPSLSFHSTCGPPSPPHLQPLISSSMTPLPLLGVYIHSKLSNYNFKTITVYESTNSVWLSGSGSLLSVYFFQFHLFSWNFHNFLFLSILVKFHWGDGGYLLMCRLSPIPSQSRNECGCIHISVVRYRVLHIYCPNVGCLAHTVPYI